MGPAVYYAESWIKERESFLPWTLHELERLSFVGYVSQLNSFHRWQSIDVSYRNVNVAYQRRGRFNINTYVKCGRRVKAYHNIDILRRPEIDNTSMLYLSSLSRHFPQEYQLTRTWSRKNLSRENGWSWILETIICSTAIQQPPRIRTWVRATMISRST